MAINSVLSTGLQGLHSGLHAIQKDAEKIAQSGTSPEPSQAGDLAAEVVGMKENELLVKASVQVIEAASDTLGTLLDVHA